MKTNLLSPLASKNDVASDAKVMSKKAASVTFKPAKSDGTLGCLGSLNVFRRAESGKYYAMVNWPGDPRRPVSLKTAHFPTAREKALALWLARATNDAATLRKVLCLTKGKSAFATIGEIIAACWSGQWCPESMRASCNQLRVVIADARGMDRQRDGWQASIDLLGADVLDYKLVRDFFAARQRAEGLDKLDLQTRRELNGRINSALNNAKGVFSRKSLAYNLRSLELPDLRGFLEEPYLPVPRQRIAAAMEPGTIRAMCDGFRHLAAIDPECWLYGAMIALMGLRNNQVEHARASWLSREDGGWWLAVCEQDAFTLAKGDRPRKIEVPEEIMSAIQGRESWLIAPDALPTERREGVERRLNVFMRRFFPAATYTKGAYLLRKMFADAHFRRAELAGQDGHAAATRALGHTVTRGDDGAAAVTRQHYLSELPKVRCITWAELGQSEIGVSPVLSELEKLEYVEA